MQIDRERLAHTFTTLCELSSPSRKEQDVADFLKQAFAGLGVDYFYEDDSATKTGSTNGNLIFRFNGTSGREPVFFACHMDTVKPGDGVQVVRDGDIFMSQGETVLGGDDKSGIAPLVELITQLKDNLVEHRTLELVFTTCEEIGLQGAKHLDHQKLQARFGYALDSTGIDKVVYGAPAANRLRVDVHGIAAHAGINPEAGVSAFQIAAHAITRLRLGRIDDESTANIGLMQGGVATNIVPEHLVLHGEIRSHSVEKLETFTEDFRNVFLETIAQWPMPEGDDTKQPSLDFAVESEYPAMRLADDNVVLETVRRAGLELGREFSFIIAGGGSDANIFNGFGLSTAIIATGMTDVHTTDESLDLNDMVHLTELLYTIATE